MIKLTKLCIKKCHWKNTLSHLSNIFNEEILLFALFHKQAHLKPRFFHNHAHLKQSYFTTTTTKKWKHAISRHIPLELIMLELIRVYCVTLKPFFHTLPLLQLSETRYIEIADILGIPWRAYGWNNHIPITKWSLL